VKYFWRLLEWGRQLGGILRKCFKIRDIIEIFMNFFWGSCADFGNEN